MIVEIDADERSWMQVPPAFPFDRWHDAAAWQSELLRRYRSVRPDADAAELASVAALGSAALDALVPGAAFGLLFMPAPAPMAALVHVEVAAPIDGGADPRVQLLGETPLAAQPEFEETEVSAGAALAVRYLIAAPQPEHGDDGASPPPAVAGIAWLVTSPAAVVRLTGSPMTTTMVGLIDAPLRGLVASLRVIA